MVVTLDKALGERLAMLRAEAAWSQTEVADRARGRGGLHWTRLTVAQIEAGERRLTAAELLTLPLIFDRNVAEILGGMESEELIGLGPDGAASVEFITSRLLAGDLEGVPFRYYGRHVDNPLLRKVRESPMAKHALQWRRILREEGLPDDAVPWPMYHAATKEAERTAARKLNLDPPRLVAISFRLWGHSLTAERDDRVANREDSEALPPRVRQALRGHMTRELLRELREQLDEGSG